MMDNTSDLGRAMEVSAVRDNAANVSKRVDYLEARVSALESVVKRQREEIIRLMDSMGRTIVDPYSTHSRS